MMSLQGCGKSVIQTAPIQNKSADFSPLLEVSADFNKSASNDVEASLMLWDLYAYIKELENSLKACIEMKGN